MRADEKREQNANDASVSRHLPPLAAPNATERNALNALVADYLDRREVPARSVVAHTRDAGGFFFGRMKAATKSWPGSADGLRRAVHRASRLDARDAAHDALSERASAASIRAETLWSALWRRRRRRSGVVWAGRGARRREAFQVGDARGEALASRAGSRTRLDPSRVWKPNARTRRATSSAPPRPRSTSRRSWRARRRALPRRFCRGAIAPRRGEYGRLEPPDSITPPTTPVTLAHTNETNETTDSITPPITPPAARFRGVRGGGGDDPRAADARAAPRRRWWPRGASCSLCSRARRRSTSRGIAARDAPKSLRLVKRIGRTRAHRDALAATAFAIARDAGEDRAVRETRAPRCVWSWRIENKRDGCACACVGSVAKLSDVDLPTRALDGSVGPG